MSSKRDVEEQFKRVSAERKPFEELRQAAKIRPWQRRAEATLPAKYVREPTRLRVLKVGLEKALDDERRGVTEYEVMAKLASELGLASIANSLLKIAHTESAHASELEFILGAGTFGEL